MKLNLKRINTIFDLSLSNEKMRDVFIEKIEKYNDRFFLFFGSIRTQTTKDLVKNSILDGFGLFEIEGISRKDILENYHPSKIRVKIIDERPYAILGNQKYKIMIPYYKGEKELILKDFNKNILDINNSNFMEIWIDRYYDSIYEAIFRRFHERYKKITLIDLYKSLLKFKWFGKDEIRKILPLVIEDIGIKFIKGVNRNGYLKEFIYPEKILIHQAFDKLSKQASCNWEKEFPEEYENGNLFIQGGDIGFVFSNKGNYKTAFVEVIPKYIFDKNKNRFVSVLVRGEGVDQNEAEREAFQKVKKMKKCLNHEFKLVNNRMKCLKCSLIDKD